MVQSVKGQPRTNQPLKTDNKSAMRALMVNNPPRYTQGSIKCIDAIKAALGQDGFIAFLRGQVIKYNWRLGLKGEAAEDSEKAAWYQNRLTEELNNAS